MRKCKKYIFLIVTICFLLTGCGKECSKWEIVDGTTSDCSSKTGAEYYKCLKNNVGKDGKVTQKCVEWK